MIPAGERAPVTVIIPLYNGARFIGETLTSIERQTLRPAEVIVIDDGSDDEGVSLAREHPVGARVVEQSHFGVAVARNRGLLLAQTPWVTFLDQDDLWLPRRLERLMDWLGEHPDEEIVVTTERPFATEDELTGLHAVDPLVGAWPSVSVPVPAYPHIAKGATYGGTAAVTHHDVEALLRGPISVTVSLIARKDLLHLAGGFAPHALAMDDYWLLVNVAKIKPIAKLDDPTVFYRVHLSATSRSTRLAVPFLSSAAALRLGGGLLPMSRALVSETLGDIHLHLLDEVQRSDAYRDPRVRRVVRHLSGILWPSGRRVSLLKAEARARAPWLSSAVRTAKERFLRG